MRNSILHFTKPVSVIQAFHHHYDYLKDQRRFEERKDIAAWQRTFQSISGFVEDGELFLPENILDSEGLKLATHITLEDVQNPSHYHFKQSQPNQCLNLQTGLVEYDSLKLKDLGTEKVEIHLNWSFMGYVEPEQYKIAELQSGTMVEIRRNRVVNGTLTGRKERTYTEAFTILQHLGSFTQATLLRAPTTPKEKALPHPTKVVNLMKLLY
jgi:hypothetical protein